MTIAAHVPNLFDRGRFQGQVVFVETAAEAADLSPSLVVVDLDRCDDVESFAIDGLRVIGFGPHVDTDLHRRATEAGYTEVLARSVFFTRLPDLLTSS